MKLGNPHGEAAALRQLTDLYEATGDQVSAIRCLERVIVLDTRLAFPQLTADSERLAGLIARLKHGGRSSVTG